MRLYSVKAKNVIQVSFMIGMFMLLVTDSAILFDDSQGLGRVFQGVGGLSGGGATSKLLVNYVDEQRNQVLDYLFKPNFGASLHILKVEIGGDAQSTDGTEASHMHNSWDENYERGYEWWIMKEAKKRNPDIKLYGLPWGFPGWIGQGQDTPWTNVSVPADYVLRWINGAKTHYNLTIDYIGIWNEKGYNIDYIKKLRSLLDNQGFENVSIVAADGSWHIASDILKDASLAKAVDIIGCHYPGTNTTTEAVKTKKALWASEDYSTFNNEKGGGCWARILNQNYVNGLMTATISWNLIGSYYAGLPFFRDGLMTAIEPWSGHYVVETPIWMTAHTSQFTQIGWNYLLHGNGVGHLPEGGSYVSFLSPDRDQFTVVIETMTHDHSKCIRPALPHYDVKPQNITVVLKGSLAKFKELNVWYSKLAFGGAQHILFKKMKTLKIVDGRAQLSLGLDEVYTLTTSSKGHKGSFGYSPPSKPFPLPYTDDFEGYKMYQEPNNLAQQTGSYEVLGSQKNQFIRQMVLQTPVNWCELDKINKTFCVVGNIAWTNIFIETDFRFTDVNSTDGIFVAGKVSDGGCKASGALGFYFFVFSDNKYILANDLLRTVVITQGYVDLTPGWHKLSLLIQDSTAVGAFDGKQQFSVKVSSNPKHGYAAIGTDSYGLADFDNLHITSANDGLAIMRKYHQEAMRNKQTLYFQTEN